MINLWTFPYFFRGGLGHNLATLKLDFFSILWINKVFFIESFLLLKCLILGSENKEKQSVMWQLGRLGEFSLGNFF